MTTRPNPRLREKVASRQCVGNNDACWVSDSSTPGPHSPYTRRMIWVLWAIMGWSEWRQCTDKWQLGKRRQPPGNSSDCSLGAAHHPHYPRCPFYQGTSTASELMFLVILMILITSSMLVMELPQPPIKRQSSKLLTPLIQPILGLSRTWKVKFLVNLQPPPGLC